MKDVFKDAKTIGTPPQDNEPVWTTKSGKEIPVSKMATSHIQNTLRMLRDKGYVSPSTLLFYLTCPLPNGRYAVEAFYEEFDRISSSPVSEFIDIFEAELKKRNISG